MSTALKVQALFGLGKAKAAPAPAKKAGKAAAPAKKAAAPAKKSGAKTSGGWLGSDSQELSLSKWCVRSTPKPRASGLVARPCDAAYVA